MINIVKQILSNPGHTVLNDPGLLLLMLRCYSNLYLCGAQCSSCKRTHQKYYDKIKQNGLEMAEKYEKSKVRTCIPNWSGSKYITATYKHWNADMITDEDATYLLSNNYLTEDMFIKLPNKIEDKVEYNEEELKCVEEIKTLLSSGYTKTKLMVKYKNVKKIGDKEYNNTMLKKLIEDNEIK